jgi:TorA maturation chaperone TorD
MSGGPDTAAVTLHPALAPEDRARGEFYAVLARLYASAPDAALLRLIAAAPPVEHGEADASLARSWNRLREASGVMDADVADGEYTALFIGVGRSEVDLHASHWASAGKSEKPLVNVRADLSRLGLARLAHVNVYEDHLSALLETMRILVLGADGRAPASVTGQRAFFHAHLDPWVDACCAAILRSAIANYYRCVAELTQSLVAIERDAFALF